MKNVNVPIKSMLGCVAVAPQGDETCRGNDLGKFGGNMDYNLNGEGTTLFFSVFHPGGLFMLADALAAMGDGELTGAALETSMDVDSPSTSLKASPPSDSAPKTTITSSPSASPAPSPKPCKPPPPSSYCGSKRTTASTITKSPYSGEQSSNTRSPNSSIPKFNVVAKVPKRALAQLKQ